MEEGQKLLGMAVEKILDLALFPIVLGGGHETTFGHFQGHLADMKKKETPLDMGIINFDAHFDLRPYENGPSSGSMFRQIADIYKRKMCSIIIFRWGYRNIVILSVYLNLQKKSEQNIFLQRKSKIPIMQRY